MMTYEHSSKSITLRSLEGEVEHIKQIPTMAIASWSELLGYQDPGEALDAILHVMANGEPEPDPVTDDNAWTEPYGALQLQKQANARAEIEAAFPTAPEGPRFPLPEGEGPLEENQARTLRRFAAAAAELDSLAEAAVTPEVASVVVADAQARARSVLGVPEPSPIIPEAARTEHGAPVLFAARSVEGPLPEAPSVIEDVKAELVLMMPTITAMRAKFLADL